MASHNRTPQSILDAPERSREILEGTHFNGYNRKQLRAIGHRGGDPRYPEQKPNHARMSHKVGMGWYRREKALRLKRLLERKAELDKAKQT